MIHLNVEGVEFSYKTSKVLENITFQINKGDIVSILGVNGAGKTTLLRIMNMILKPKKGAVYLNGKNLRHANPREIARKIGYVAQFHPRMQGKVFEAVLLGRKPHIKWRITRKDIEKVEKSLEILGLSGYSMREVHQLSGGEFQKVILARALAQEPEVLLLDEPTANLDIKNQIEVMDLIRRITKEKEISTIVVMHDINLALRFTEKFILMKKGKVFKAGGLEIITEENLYEVYGIKSKIVKINNIPCVIPENKRNY